MQFHLEMSNDIPTLQRNWNANRKRQALENIKALSQNPETSRYRRIVLSTLLIYAQKFLSGWIDLNHPAQKKYDIFNAIVANAQNSNLSDLEFLNSAIQNIEELGNNSTSSLIDALTMIRAAKGQLEIDIRQAWATEQRNLHDQEFRAIRDYADSDTCTIIRKPILGAVIQYADQKFNFWLNNQDEKQSDPYHEVVALAKNLELEDEAFLDQAKAAVLTANPYANRNNPIYLSIEDARRRHRHLVESRNQREMLGVCSSVISTGITLYAFVRNPIYLMVPFTLVTLIKLVNITNTLTPRTDNPSLLDQELYEHGVMPAMSAISGGLLAPYRIFLSAIGNALGETMVSAIDLSENTLNRFERLTGIQSPQAQPERPQAQRVLVPEGQEEDQEQRNIRRRGNVAMY